MLYVYISNHVHSGLAGCINDIVESCMGFFFNMPNSLTFSRKLCVAINATDSRSFFFSSMSRFILARRFWNQVMTYKLEIEKKTLKINNNNRRIE